MPYSVFRKPSDHSLRITDYRLLITAMKVPHKPFTWLFGSLLLGLLLVWARPEAAAWLPRRSPFPVLARFSITNYQLPTTNYHLPFTIYHLPTSIAQPSILSPIWAPDIQQWSAHIAVLSDVYGLDPDFILSLIHI